MRAELRFFFLHWFLISLHRKSAWELIGPQNYIVHKNSESPDGRYGVLVLSNEAAVKEDQTEGNSIYLADLRLQPVKHEKEDDHGSHGVSRAHTCEQHAEEMRELKMHRRGVPVDRR